MVPHKNVECQIDSISQSWSVLSGAGDPKRSRMAMQAVDRRLVRREDSIIQLLDPPRSTNPIRIPAISADMFRAYVRTADSTRMRRSGP
ncbi:GH36-type glycosyl hydrolase domain-containing protein [Undibacterium arcticum]